MLEYVFFEESIRDRFAAFARDKGVAVELDEEGMTALVPEDIEDVLSDELDELYERLLQDTAELIDGGIEKSAAGVRVELSDGTPCQIVLDSDLMARLLQSISLEELRDMVQDIARAVENPKDLPICKMVD